MNISAQSAFGLLGLLLAPLHAFATDDPTTITTNDSIQFIALPYLNAFHHTKHMQAVIIARAPERQNLSANQWRITTTSIPEYQNHSDILKIIDTAQARGSRLGFGRDIMIPLPCRIKPVTAMHIEQNPLWIHWLKTGSSQLTWHAPMLTPVAAELAIAEQKRKAKLAKRMADRAFYFGYDTNNDALK